MVTVLLHHVVTKPKCKNRLKLGPISERSCPHFVVLEILSMVLKTLTVVWKFESVINSGIGRGLFGSSDFQKL